MTTEIQEYGTTYTLNDAGDVISQQSSDSSAGTTPYSSDVSGAASDYATNQNFWDKLAGSLGMKGSTLAAAVGGISGLLGANTATPQKVGYLGKIPKYEATRTALNPVDYSKYTPGQGHKYFSDVTYNLLGELATPTTAPAPATTTPATTTTTTPATTGYTDPGYDTQMVPTGAHGGLASLKKGRYLIGESDGMADKVKANIDGNQEARLSHGEFVIPADVVSHLGNGNSDAGAKRLYDMMDRIRKARTGTKQQGKQINPNKFLPK